MCRNKRESALYIHTTKKKKKCETEDETKFLTENKSKI